MEIYKYEQEKELEMLNISVKGLNLKLDWNTLKFCDWWILVVDPQSSSVLQYQIFGKK